jgi:hypothetical protein
MSFVSPARNIGNKKPFPISLAWSAIAGADRINEGKYFNTIYNNVPEIKLNKNLALDFCISPYTLTDEDKVLGEKLAAHFSGLLFKTLTGPIANGFMSTIANIVAMENVGKYEIACMACLVNVYRKDLVREQHKEKIDALSANSEYLGQEGSKQELIAEIVETVYSRTYECLIVTAIAGGNVVKFFTSKDKELFPLNGKVTLKGTVKRNSINDRNGVKESWLTRVKVVNQIKEKENAELV